MPRKHEARAARFIVLNFLLLEGLQVRPIVVALGVQAHHSDAAAAAAILALVVVALAGALALTRLLAPKPADAEVM